MGELISKYPWSIKEDRQGDYGAIDVFSKNGSWVASVHSHWVSSPINQVDANAKLIAAAPDLLAALIVAEKMLWALSSDQFPESTRQMINDAIAKAIGND